MQRRQDPMNYPKVLDREWKERDEQWVKEEYGLIIVRVEVLPGDPVYRVDLLQEKTGPSSHVTQVTMVVKGEHSPTEGIDVAWYWPDAPDPPDPPTELYDGDWHSNFVHGLTGPNGDVGPGMGKGAMRNRGGGGPHKVWVRDPNIASDLVRDIGWRTGTPHDHLDVRYVLVNEPEGPSPPVPTDGLAELYRKSAECHRELARVDDLMASLIEIAEYTL